MFIALANHLKPTGIRCHQAEVLEYEEEFYAFCTFRGGSYLNIFRSKNGWNWVSYRTMKFPDDRILYVSVCRFKEKFLLYYVVRDGDTWKINMASLSDLSGEPEIFGTVIEPSYDDDFCGVGSGSCLSIKDNRELMMWYTGMDKDHGYNVQVSHSFDGIKWEKKGTAYRYRGEDAYSCSKPSVVGFEGKYYMFFSKTNPSGVGYQSIGSAFSIDGLHFVDFPVNINVIAHPFGAKYPSVLFHDNDILMWSMRQDSFPSEVIFSPLKRIEVNGDTLPYGKLSAGERKWFSMDLNGETIEVFFRIDRAEVDVLLDFPGVVEFRFSNGQVFITHDGKVGIREFTPCGELGLVIRFHDEGLEVKYGDSYSGASYCVVSETVVSENCGFFLSVMENSFKKRNGTVIYRFSKSEGDGF